MFIRKIITQTNFFWWFSLCSPSSFIVPGHKSKYLPVVKLFLFMLRYKDMTLLFCMWSSYFLNTICTREGIVGNFTENQWDINTWVYICIICLVSTDMHLLLYCPFCFLSWLLWLLFGYFEISLCDASYFIFVLFWFLIALRIDSLLWLH